MNRVWWGHRPKHLKPVPWYVAAGVALAVIAVDYAIGYILANTGLPNVAGLWGWLAISFTLALGYNIFAIREFQDWWRTR